MLTRSSGKLAVPPVKESMRKKHLVNKQVKKAVGKAFKPANTENYIFVQPPADDGRPEAGTARSLAFRAHVIEYGGQTFVPPPDFCWGEPEYDRPLTPEPGPPGPVYHATSPTYSPTSPSP